MGRLGRNCFPCGDLIKAGLDGFDGSQFLHGILHFLVGFAAKQNGFSPAIHRQHLRSASLIHPVQMILGVALEVGEGMNVFKLEHALDKHEISCFTCAEFNRSSGNHLRHPVHLRLRVVKMRAEAQQRLPGAVVPQGSGNIGLRKLLGHPLQ